MLSWMKKLLKCLRGVFHYESTKKPHTFLVRISGGCGGNFRYTEAGIKDCSGCLFPHRRENYDRVTARFMEIVKKMQEGE